MRKVRPSTFGGAVPLSPVRRAGSSAAPLAIGTSGNASVRPLVLLIDFDDKPHTQGASQLASLFFANGPRDFSVKNYWEEASYTRQGTNIPGRTFQVLVPTPNVVGWLRAGTDFPTAVTSYAQCTDGTLGANVTNIRQLIADAVAWLDSPAGRAAWNVTFSQYRGATGTAVQALILVHPGFGAEDSGSPSQDIYSHRGEFPNPVPTTLDGTTVGDYLTVPESQFYSDPTPLDNTADDPLIGIGVIVHEMGHLLGLPDLYPTGATGQTAGSFSGVGVYDLMGYGMWGSNLQIRADNPAHPSAWSKAELGWVSPQPQLSTAVSLLFLRPFEYYPDVHQVFPNSADSTQWFLIENRQRVDTTFPAPAWLFDNFLPGAGVLIWHIDASIADNAVVRSLNIVNNDNVYKGVDVEEANGRNLLGMPIPQPPPPLTLNDLAPYFGQVSDYFTRPTDEFSRVLPVPGVNLTNSTPIVGVLPFLSGVSRPPDFGDNVTLTNFTALGQRLPNGTLTSYFFYDLLLSTLGGGGAPGWKTFNIVSTQRYPVDNTVPVPRGPMRSDDILSVAFDSGNNVWMGSRDQGIFRFLGTRFEILGASEGLPSVSLGSSTLSPIRTMAFEDNTGSMWVGTDSGLFKVRNAGAGFRVQTSFTTSSVPGRRIASNVIRGIAVRRALGLKYAATPSGLYRIQDGLTDSESDDRADLILTGNVTGEEVTAVAIDDSGTPDVPTDDIVWVGFSDGRFTRSLVRPETGAPPDADPRFSSHFKSPFYTLNGSPRINALAVDKKGVLWIGTEGLGVQAFDLGETLSPAQPNLRDPYDFDHDGNMRPEPTAVQVYLNTALGAASDNVTGIAFQVTADEKPVAWLSHFPDTGGAGDPTGGATRVNIADNTVRIFRPEAGVAPADQVNGPPSMWLSTAAADPAGNVWFGTTAPGAAGASRFGNAGIISLDSSNYVNITAVATVTVQDDGLNTDSTVANRAIVQVTSAQDGVGFLLYLNETGPDTGVFTGRFGFALGASDTASSPPRIAIQNGNAVTVTYFDANPRGVRTASATWKKVYPFEDSLIIDNFSCFIATAAYGSVMAPEVRMFRRFRDEFLLTHPAGRAFVGAYYRWSPSLAALIARSDALRFTARTVLAPVSLAAGFAVAAGPMEILAVAFVLTCMAAALLRGLPGRGVTNRRARTNASASIK